MKPIIEFIKADLSIVLLAVAVLISAISVVYVKHIGRAQFVELQKLEAKRDRLNEEWGRLLLEQSTWATPGRVEYEARKRLKMIVPTAEMTVVIKP
jgi:cell division protein FtsL